MEKEIIEIHSIKSSLKHLLQQYEEYKHNSNFASKKNDRSKASKSMIIYANLIENELCKNSLVYNEINSGNPYQFEGFWEHVEFYLPDYIKKIDSLLERLKSKEEEEENK